MLNRLLFLAKLTFKFKFKSVFSVDIYWFSHNVLVSFETKGVLVLNKFDVDNWLIILNDCLCNVEYL